MNAALAWHSGAAGQPGPGRPSSEDNHLNAPEAGLWAVADGMGGHRDGALASAMLVEGLHAALVPLAPLGQRVAAAQAAIGEVANRLSKMAGTGRSPGSTISVLLLGESHAVCLWVGDSRIYLRRNGTLFQLTRDHSLAQEMIDSGLIASAEEARAAERSGLTRAVGAGATLAIDRVVVPVQAGDRLLICTDGVSTVVPAAAMVAALDSTPVEAAQALIKLAAEMGGFDDVTALVVAIDAAL